jgi:SPP1 gp7 family putative phage head morphogenesis protein
MRRVFLAQRREVLKRLEEHPPETPRVRIVPSDIFSEAEWEELFKTQLEALRAIAFREIAIETLGVLPTEAEFLFTPEMAARLQADGARLVKGVNHTTRNLLARELSQATEAGESIDQVASRVRKVFATRRKHARTIARTEMLRASQDAQMTAFRISGVVESKRWNTSLDASVRDTHALTNGQVVPVSLPFTLGDGERSDGPGLGHGGVPLSPGNAINCRCFLTPVLP